MRRDMIVFGEDWGRHPSSTQHIITNLVEARRILWVNSIGLRRPRLTRSDFARATSKLTSFIRRSGGEADHEAATDVTPSLASPFVIPWPGNGMVNQLNGSILKRFLKPRIERLGLDRPILWTSLPTALPVVGKLGERAVVYYCGDDFGSLAGVDHGPVSAMEAELAKKADLVIVASKELAARFPDRKTIFLPHGVDVDLFSKRTPPAADLPQDRPVAGFYGAIADWIDVPMLVKAAQRLSEWIFVFVGPIATDISPLLRLPNVRFLGPRPHHALASYSQHWTVSLIPFRDCPQIHSCNPLKLREYLAAGTPIAATDFPALKPYTPLVSLADGSDDFADAILRAADDANRNGLRRGAVADESWRNRAAFVDYHMERL